MDYVEPCQPRASVSVETQILEDLGLDPKTQKALRTWATWERCRN